MMTQPPSTAPKIILWMKQKRKLARLVVFPTLADMMVQLKPVMSTVQILRDHQEWPLLAGLLSNRSIIYYRLGQGHDAVSLIREARDIWLDTGDDQELCRD